MNTFAITLLDIIINHGNDLVQRNALIACRNELVGVPTEEAAPVASEAAPAAPVSLADAPVAVAEEDSEHDRPSETFSEAIRKSAAYDAMYEEGKGKYLLLDGEDEIEEGDEWIAKPGLSTIRTRMWRAASDIGSEVSEFSRSNYRRKI